MELELRRLIGLFTGVNSVRFFPWSLPAIPACAELSYWCVERPSLRLRERLEVRFHWQEKLCMQS